MEASGQAVHQYLFDLADAFLALVAAAVLFSMLARVVKPTTWLRDAQRALPQARLNAMIALIDQIAVVPLVAIFVASAAAFAQRHQLVLNSEPLWIKAGFAPTVLTAVFVGDFIGYWRHRIQHTRWLWPAHAIHHSDTHLTWLSLARMHPIDRFGSAMDAVLLIALGLPLWALSLNVFIRHWYGYLIHADVPWTLGKAGWVLNTPVMHRWHHARDVDGSGYNFATVFSVFDTAFGTYYQPGPCNAPLGVREDMGRGVVGQYLHPFRAWRDSLMHRPKPLHEQRETLMSRDA